MHLYYSRPEQIFNIHEGSVPYLSFRGLDALPGFVNAFSTRMGGVSEGALATMNFSYHKGDAPEHVLENFTRMAAAIGVDRDKMVCSHQTHTTNIMKVFAEDAGKGVIRHRGYKNIDGLITNVPGITLVTSYADCIPLYFVDPVRRAVGISHSGWRGTVGRMGQKTVELMCREFGCRAEDIHCGIGPGICRECFEVGDEVAEKFRKAFPKNEWDTLIFPQHVQGRDPARRYIDLWRANELILTGAGILPDHIYKTNVCTKHNSALLYSHRVTGAQRGNLCGFLGIRETA